MFERTKIKWATARAIDRSSMSEADRNYLYHAVTNSPMLPAAINGLKADALDSGPAAVAYLLAAIIDATSRSDDKEGHHRGEIAELAAHTAMLAAGATIDEAKAVIDDCVALHERSALKLDLMVKQNKSD